MNPAWMMIEHGCTIDVLLLGRQQKPAGRPTFLAKVVPLLLGIARIWEAHLLAVDLDRHVVIIIPSAISVA